MCHINVCVILNVKQKYQKLWTMFLCCYCFCCMVMEKIKSEIWVEGNNEAFTLIGWLRYMYKNIFKWSPSPFPGMTHTYIQTCCMVIFILYCLYACNLTFSTVSSLYQCIILFYFFLNEP